jgi:NADH:ubiquinone oxidoreductase subunit
MDDTMIWLARLFSWWHGATLNTRFYTWLRGEFVGQDEFGNAY